MITRYNLRLSEFLLPGHVEGLQTEQYKTTYLSDDTLRMWLRAPTIDSTQLCGIDIETYAAPGWEDKAGAAIHNYSARIRSIQIYDGKEVTILDFMLPDGTNLLNSDRIVLSQVCTMLQNGTWTAHNAQFEVNHFTRLLEMNGTPSELTIYCTMNAYRLILQADSWDWKKYDATLKGVSRRVLGVDVDKEISHDKWAVSGKFDEDQLRYCTLDAVLPRLLLNVLFQNLSELEMVAYYKLNTRLHNVIGHMTLFGNPIDTELHSELIAEWQIEYDKAHLECFELLNSDKGFALVSDFNEFIVGKVTAKQVAMVTEFVELFMWGKDVGDCSDLLALQIALAKKAAECAEDESKRRAFNRAAKNIEEYLVSPGSDKQLSDWAKTHVPQELLDEWTLTDASIKYVEECRTAGVEIDPKKVQLKMDAETFDDLGELEVIEPISRFKKYSKLLSTYGVTLQNFYVNNPWMQGVTTVHPQYSLCYTETGRLSTSKPSCQQLPRQPKGSVGLRTCFITQGDDYEYISSDLSQIELRADAEITGDPVMLEVYETGGDIHATTASGILARSGLTREMISEADWEATRDSSKNVNFACIYGGGAAAVKKGGRKSGMHHPLEVWQTFVDAYRETYSVARQVKLDYAEECKRTLKSRVPYGKVCALHPDYAFTQSANFRVQGSAFVVLAIGLCELYKVYCERKDLDFRIFKTVHDSIDVGCRKDQVDVLKQLITKCFETGMLTVFPEATTLNLVGIKSGPNWGDLK